MNYYFKNRGIRHPILVHPIFGASYLHPSVPSSVVLYISVSYFTTSYLWFSYL